MAQKTIPVAVRLTEDIVKQIDAVADNRARFITDAIRYKLDPESFETHDLTDKEKRDVLKGTKNLHDIVSDALVREAQRRNNFLASMSNEDLARLMVARLPKESDNTGDLERDVLSLKDCIQNLPDLPDITKELNRVKGELHKVTLERDLNLKLLRYSENKTSLSELAGLFFRDVVEYVCSMVSRNSLPGLGDGGGLTDAGYAEISKQVRNELEKLEILRKK